MKRLAKFITALQALLLAPLGAAKAGDVATPSDFTETAAWEAALSTGTPEALQQFIAHYPQGERLGDAFGLIVQGEVDRAATDLQLSEAPQEVLEHEFDRGVIGKNLNPDEDNRGLTPY